ncbi:MAG TPA: DUF2167 domain-containing protein [Candidatus Polarisedimenticolia bacterium]|nr:DUF2167 domain-containing protein [Candidatus Polarisedimenticolia bacterium]
MARHPLIRLGTLVFCLSFAARLRADGPKGLQATPEEFEAKLGYQTGTITLPGGMATIRLPESFRYLGAEGSRRLLTEGWGNPPAMADDVIGMLVPRGVSPVADEGWGIVITYEEDGYVNDDDAASINYDKMLKQLQDATVAANAERKKQGFEPLTMVGWAEPPSYDGATHKLYWAKELMFGENPNHTLNYNIRILGRRGVLVLNAVASMDQMEAIKGETQNVLAAVDFNEGHRYADYLPGKDKAAAYGIAGLILGATAAKAGFFKLLWVGILAFKKFALIGIAGLATMLRRVFTRRKSDANAQPTPNLPGP